MLVETHAFCVDRRMAFKHLRTPRTLLRHNGKYAPRGSSGKFVTIYPPDEAALGDVLKVLGERLAGTPHPYILGDLRIGSGPLHVRYGAFRHLEIDDGESLTLAMRRPDGVLVPDRRGPVFRVPEWVTPPEVLRPHLDQKASATLPFRIVKALHFSNGGGVYRAIRHDDGQAIIVKEARPHAGLDAYGRDAVDRLRQEHAALTALAGVPGVPETYGLVPAWEHLFLMMSEIPGIPLGRWMARNFPVHADADPAPYLLRAGKLADRLDALLARVHAAGRTFGDLHPRNVLVDEDDQVRLVDAELSAPADADTAPGLGAPGFRAPAHLRGPAIDEYALRAVRRWLTEPLAPMTELGEPARDDWPGGDWPAARDALSRAIHASATPERDDRLFPGDIRQFLDVGGGVGFGYGAAGVLYALTEAGLPVRPEFTDWLSRRAGVARLRPGLWTGAHGIAYVLDLLGRPEEADDLLFVPERAARPGLAGGASGIAMALLRIGQRRGDQRLTDAALGLGRRLDPGPSVSRAGLLHGWSGAALLFVRLFEHGGDPVWLDRADRAVARDLARCEPTPGGLQVRDGSRLLPYLDSGAAGVWLAAGLLARHRPDAVSASALPGLREACRARFVIYPGLMQGRAGLLYALAELGDSAAAEHLGLFGAHAVAYGKGFAFPGESLRRLSMDLHTGTAGVLLALARWSVRTPTEGV